jgi:hypothetical protein
MILRKLGDDVKNVYISLATSILPYFVLLSDSSEKVGESSSSLSMDNIIFILLEEANRFHEKRWSTLSLDVSTTTMKCRNVED